MLAPAKPPRVASKLAPVTRVSVLAARGMLPAASPMPFNVVRLDSLPEPRIEAPPGPIVTLDIVLAVAVRSPTTDGDTCPLTPSFHRSADPGSGSLARTAFDARSGRAAVTRTAASTARSRARLMFATSSRSVPCRCTRRRSVLNPVALT